MPPPATRLATPSSSEELDVAVVGAGVAGCYVAFRLTEPDLPRSLERASPLAPGCGRSPVLKVALFEAGARIGGRLWSVAEAGGGPPCELGAMRFVPGSPVLEDLIAHLGLSGARLPFPFDPPENLVFVRGVRLRRGEMDGAASRLPYALGPHGGDPGAIEERIAERAVPGFSRLRARYHRCAGTGDRSGMTRAADAYRGARSRGRVAGHALHRLSWRELLELTHGGEAACLLEASGGYECSASIGNAAGWLDDRFFAPPGGGGQECLGGGFQELALALHRRFQARGGRTLRRHRLLGVDRISRTEGDDPAYGLTFEREGGRRLRVRARVLVLALPRPALERLDRDGFLFASRHLRDGLDSVIGVGAFKLLLGYRRAWWHAVHVAPGRSTTDLPIRQVHYPRPRGGTAGRCVLTAAYVNGPDVDFWRSLDRGGRWPGPESQLQDAPPDSGSVETPRPATRRMVQAAHEMLLQLHGVACAPLPELAFCHDWSSPPHGAGWHVWKPGVRPDEVARRMLRPLPRERVFVVGECWSARRAGSVPGALVTAERVLCDHLRVRSPAWMPGPLSGDEL